MAHESAAPLAMEGSYTPKNTTMGSSRLGVAPCITRSPSNDVSGPNSRNRFD